MSTEFLDKSGLSYFWSKIKAWINQRIIPSTLYLDAVNGDDNNDGSSSSSAMKTIAHLESVVSNSPFVPSKIVVYVASGTYNDSIQGSTNTFLQYNFSSGSVMNGAYVYGSKFVTIGGTFTSKNTFFAAVGGIIEIGINRAVTTITYNNANVYAVFRTQDKGIIRTQYGSKKIAVDFTGTCSVTDVISVEAGGHINLGYNGDFTRIQWSGSVTGRKYHVTSYSMLLATGPAADIPGTNYLVDTNGYVAV